MEADYLKRTVGSYLAEGLAEVSSKRPSDPVEYLALWLLKQKQNIVNREELEKAHSSQPPPEPITITVEEDTPKDSAPQDSAAEEFEVTPPVPMVTADVERPSSKLDIIEEEPDDEPVSSDPPKPDVPVSTDNTTEAEVPVNKEPPIIIQEDIDADHEQA